MQVPGCLTSLKPTEERGLREFLVRLEVTSRRGDGMSFPDWACAKRSTSQKHSDAPVHMNALPCVPGYWRSAEILGQSLPFPLLPQNLTRSGDILEQESLNLGISVEERPC